MHEATDHGCWLLGEFINRAMHETCRLDIAVSQQLIELLLADLLGSRLAQRVLAHFAQPLTPIVEDGLKSAFARPVADKTVGITQFLSIGIHRNSCELHRAVDKRRG